MRVLALVSGGKDSCYAMMKCVEHGHVVVAIANLHPPSGDVRELDSFMYQTIGSDLVPALAEALGLPLFRAPITGAAVDQGLHYACVDGDEVEDLYRLLERARSEVPFDAVCSGAILSNYQRTRVEDICSRLGLDSLAYLWQREQGPLLSEMAAAGVEAVLVKVASLGLGAGQLNRTIGSLEPMFAKLHARFGFHQCGEGGEYETFTLDCPLFLRRLELRGARHIEHMADSSGMAPVVLLAADGAELVDKEAVDGRTPGRQADGAWWAVGRRAAEADAEEEALGAARAAEAEAAGELTAAGEWADGATAEAPEEAQWRSTSSAEEDAGGGGGVSGWLRVPSAGACVLAFGPRSAAAATRGGSLDAEAVTVAQLSAAFSSLPAALAAAGLAPSHLLYVRLYVGDMAHYGAVNAAYAQVMKEAPAARACVQIPLGGGAHVALEVLAASAPKRHLHVSSISEWAPRMIGPYCQMTSADGLAHVAGNLGLLPQTMRLVGGGVEPQTRLALANSAAVLGGLGFRAERTLALLCYVRHASDLPAAQRTCRAWLSRQAQGARRPALLVLQVGGLPMGALVEAQVEACAGDAAAVLAEEWEQESQSVLLRCSAYAVDSTAGATERTRRVRLQCVALPAGEGSEVDLAHLPGAMRAATAAALARLGAVGPLHGGSFARGFYDAAIGVAHGAIERALREGSLGGEDGAAPAVMAVPVERIGHRRARLALQLQVAVALPGGDGDED